jgi:peptidoglycan/LPS O-acetylase OafA/YrhL
LGQVQPWPQPIGFWTSPIILEFAFGLAIGFARAEGVALGIPARLVLAAAGFALLGLDGARPDFVSETVRPFVWGVPAALIVAAAALGPERSRAKTVATRIAVAVGDASYALYLTHPFVIRGLHAAAARVDGATILGGWGFVAVALVGATIVALVVHAAFERPILERVRASAIPKPSIP